VLVDSPEPPAVEGREPDGPLSPAHLKLPADGTLVLATPDVARGIL